MGSADSDTQGVDVSPIVGGGDCPISVAELGVGALDAKGGTPVEGPASRRSLVEAELAPVRGAQAPKPAVPAAATLIATGQRGLVRGGRGRGSGAAAASRFLRLVWTGG